MYGSISNEEADSESGVSLVLNASHAVCYLSFQPWGHSVTIRLSQPTGGRVQVFSPGNLMQEPVPRTTH